MTAGRLREDVAAIHTNTIGLVTSIAAALSKSRSAWAKSHGQDQLRLTDSRGYPATLLGSAHVMGDLIQRRTDCPPGFQIIVVRTECDLLRRSLLQRCVRRRAVRCRRDRRRRPAPDRPARSHTCPASRAGCHHGRSSVSSEARRMLGSETVNRRTQDFRRRGTGRQGGRPSAFIKICHDGEPWDHSSYCPGHCPNDASPCHF